jgi:hypothetical protein
MMTDAKDEAEFGSVELVRQQAGDLDVAIEQMSPIEGAPRLIFVHSSFRTSSTWFWSKFRPLRETVCYYEPFNDELETITCHKAGWAGFSAWDSRHPPSEPYYLEYLPLIQAAGGVALYERSFNLDWFIPTGGIRGKLRPAEIKYLTSLIDHAHLSGKIPVLEDTRSLGRLWPLKNSFGGFHIFLYRNLWRQWLSYLYYRRRRIVFFYNTTAGIMARSGDPFLTEIANFYAKRALEFHQSKEKRPRSDGEREYLLHSLPENHAFALFITLHIYLYLHARSAADLTVDITGGYYKGRER